MLDETIDFGGHFLGPMGRPCSAHYMDPSKDSKYHDQSTTNLIVKQNVTTRHTVNMQIPAFLY